MAHGLLDFMGRWVGFLRGIIALEIGGGKLDS